MARINLEPHELADLDQQLAEFKDHLFNLSDEAARHAGDSECSITSSLCAGTEVFGDLLGGTGGHPVKMAAVAGAALRLLGETRLEVARLRAERR